jgi:hypothetical protein
MQNKNSFNKLQTLLQKQGWYVAWDDDQVSPPSTHPYGPFKGQDIDPDKVLICTPADQGYKTSCEHCHGEGFSGDVICEHCNGVGLVLDPHYEYEGGYFHFGASDKAIEYLIDNLPVIERCECNYDWDIMGGNTIFISWSKNDPTIRRLFIVALFYAFVWISTQGLYESCGDKASCYVEGLSGMALDHYMQIVFQE